LTKQDLPLIRHETGGFSYVHAPYTLHPVLSTSDREKLFGRDY